MPRRRAGFPPAYQLHAGRNLARLTVGSRDIYLGPFGSRESYDKYAAVLRYWARQQPIPDDLDVRCTVRRLTERSMEHARRYCVKRGQPTGRIDRVKAAVAAVVGMYGDRPVDEFGPRLLEDVRDALIRKELARTYIHAVVKCLVRMFKWGGKQELVPPDIDARLDTVEPLKEGRTASREPVPVAPVADTTVDATSLNSGTNHSQSPLRTKAAQ